MAILNRKDYDFCPYEIEGNEFRKIDMNNLAYELVFNQDFSAENAFQNDYFKRLITVRVNNKNRFIAVEKDNTRSRILASENMGEKNPSILFEGCLEVFKKNIDSFKNEDILEKDDGDIIMPDDSFGKDERETPLMIEDKLASVRGIGRLLDSDQENSVEKNPAYIISSYKPIGSGLWEFYNEDTLVMTAIPCCPHCHMRLPKDWKEKEDFCVVSLVGPTGSGKTTMLLSMMYGDWQALNSVKIKKNDHEKRIHVEISSANYEGFGGFYDQLIELTKELIKKCPEQTEKTYMIPPVFLLAEYGEHKLIFGIYDNAGENLSEGDIIRKHYLKAAVLKSDVDIFLFDPADKVKSINDEKESTSKLREEMLKRCEILEINKQGEKQKSDHGSISAKEVLKEIKAGIECGSEKENREYNKIDKTLQICVKLRKKRKEMKQASKDRSFMGIVIKSDLLKENEEINGEFGDLFLQKKKDLSNINSVTKTTYKIVEMVKHYKLIGVTEDDEFDDISRGYNDCSWHCVSALGCDAEEHGALKGTYNPIRVSEPLEYCIINRIAQNGWIQ